MLRCIFFWYCLLRFLRRIEELLEIEDEDDIEGGSADVEAGGLSVLSKSHGGIRRASSLQHSRGKWEIFCTLCPH